MKLAEVYAPSRKFKVGDVVRAVKDVGRRTEFGPMKGEVIKVVPFKSMGGVEQKVRVRWENGAEGLHDDRQLALDSDTR